jgi:hypothetical protein
MVAFSTRALLALAIIFVTGCGSTHASSSDNRGSSHPAEPILFATSFDSSSPWNAPCPRHPITSFDLQDCELRMLHVVNRQVNSVVKSLWHDLGSPPARVRFLISERARQTYARRTCEVRAGTWLTSPSAHVYAGGSEAPVRYASCEVEFANAYLKDLERTRNTLRPR